MPTLSRRFGGCRSVVTHEERQLSAFRNLIANGYTNFLYDSGKRRRNIHRCFIALERNQGIFDRNNVSRVD